MDPVVGIDYSNNFSLLNEVKNVVVVLLCILQRCKYLKVDEAVKSESSSQNLEVASS